MNVELLKKTVNDFWDTQIIDTIINYIKIPNKSPSFDPDWKKNGHMDKVLNLASEWTKSHLPEKSKLTIENKGDRTPLLLVDIPGDKEGNILMYGHLDKQPEMSGWDKGKGPWKPVFIRNKLYGRGGADDGYALFSSICAVNALKKQRKSLPRILILIEFSEESGSPDLPYYMKLFSETIGSPDLVICLDSGTGDYKRFWTTTSLRGLIGLSLRVDVLKEGVHSGGASGYVPSSFRIVRNVLSKIENQETGEILLKELKTKIPDHRIKEAERFVRLVGKDFQKEFPWIKNIIPSTNNNVEGVLRRTWKPALSIIGARGLPNPNNSGNVLRPFTELQLSIRIPPGVDPKKAKEALRKKLHETPPYNAKISTHFHESASGWNAPKTEPWLSKAIDDASLKIYNQPSCSLGEGGTIPFMAMLGESFPEAQFVITGVLGPGSNAHGPNEFLHIPYAKNLTSSIAMIINQFQK